MVKTSPSSLLAVALATVFAATAHGADLLAYNFDSLDGTPSYQVPGVSGSIFDRDPDHFIVYSTLVGSPQPAAVGNAWDAATFDSGRYFTFTLNAGAALTLDTVQFDLLATPEEGGDGGPTRFALRSSLDGFSSDAISGTLGSSFATETFSPHTAVGVSQAIEFRIYAWGTANGGATLSADNVRVTGAIAVPEPSTAVLAGLALIGIAFWRRTTRGAA
jgi:PEP-CTERM motif